MIKKIYLLTMVLFAITNLYGSKSIVINLSSQTISAKENGKTVFSRAVSTGKSGRATPTGSFRILEKDRFHISNKYPEPRGGAKMPYMLRLTNGGIAIHQGHLPGYPASHGCIRVSKSTAVKLWNWASVGTRVSIHGNASNFRYAKRKSTTKKYTKHIKKKKVYKKHYAKRKVYKKKVYKKVKHVRKYVKRVKRKRVVRRYAKVQRRARSSNGYRIVEVYDSW